MFRCGHIVRRPPLRFPITRNFSVRQQPVWQSDPQAGDGARKMQSVVDGSDSKTVKSKEFGNKEKDITFWKPNTLYNPLDFLRSRSSKPSQRTTIPFQVGPDAQEALRNDAFRQLDIDPLREVNNSDLLKRFITPMGKIRPRSQTKLSWRSQRKVAKAIRRAKQKGVLSILGNSGFITR